MKTGIDYLWELQNFAKEVIDVMNNADYLPDDQHENILSIMSNHAELVKFLQSGGDWVLTHKECCRE